MTTTCGIYLRVSDERQLDGHSLDAQERMARELAKREGWHIHEVYRDEARRGGTDKRPAFQRMMEDVKERAFSIVIVYALDRFSREEDAERHHKFLRQHGARVVSLTEQINDDTPAGWFMRYMMGGMAAYYSKELGQKYQRGKRERISKGLSNGDLCFGYTRNPLTKLDEPDSDADGVMMAFTAYATGTQSYSDIAFLLNKNGYRSKNKRRRRLFNGDTVRQLIANRFYTGEVSYKKEWFPGKHTAIITKELFERCQETRVLRRTLQADHAPHATQRRVYPLSNILYCHECELRYKGQNHSKRDQRFYYHAARLKQTNCTQLATIDARLVENQLAELLSYVAIPDNWRDQISRYIHQPDTSALANANAQQELTEQLRRLQVIYLDGGLSDADYQRRRADIQHQLAALAQQSTNPPKLVTLDDCEQALAMLTNFQQIYELADDYQRQELYRLMFEAVFVREKEIAAVRPTAAIYPLLVCGSGPDGIRARLRQPTILHLPLLWQLPCQLPSYTLV